jgi:predicted phosphodiesterase
MKRPASKRTNPMLWLLSVIIVASMVCSLIVTVLPSQGSQGDTLPPPPPTRAPLWTPSPVPPTPTPAPTATPEPTATPAPPTATPEPTPTPTPEPVALAVLGGSPFSAAELGDTLAAVAARGATVALHTGDLTADGAEASYQAYADAVAAAPIPVYAVPGNLDAVAEYGPYLAHSGAPALHYSFDRGPLHVAVVDASAGVVGDEELAWLAADLEASAQPAKIVALHYPPFHPAGHPSILQGGNEALMEIAAAQGVDLVLAGHLNDYVEETRDGVRYVVVGGMGEPTPNVRHVVLVTVTEGEIAVEVAPATAP